MRHRIALAVLLLLEAATFIAVGTRVPAPVPVDWHEPLVWLERTDPETATLVLARWAVLGLAGWLLVGTVGALVVEALLATGRLPRLLRGPGRAAARLAPGAVHRLVQAAVTASLVTAATTGSALAATGAAPDRARPAAAARPLVTPLAPVRDGRATTPPPVLTVVPPAPEDEPPALSPPPPEPPPLQPSPPPPAPPTPPLPRTDAATRHVVEPGESLWTIAEDHRRAHGGTDDPDAVDRYWRALCDANRHRIASGDLDTILPGEDLDLPPVA